MKIVGFALKKVSSERINPIKGKLEMKSNINIDNIEKEEVSFSDKDSLKFDFTFSIDYNPDLAKIEIKGSVVTIDEKDESKEILKDWKKKKFDNPGIKLGIFNFILNKCNLKALLLEEELGLPLHIPFPKLAPAKTNSEKTSGDSPKYAG